MSGKRVVLVNTNRLKPGVPPVALDYLAAACEDKGVEVEILDLCYSTDTRADIAAYFKDRKPDLVGVSVRNLDDVFHSIFFLPGVKKIVDEIKQAVDSPVVLGGSGFSIAPEQILDYFGVDLGVAGEGEEALPALAESVGNSSTYPSIPGLVYRTESGIQRNPLGAIDLNAANIGRRGYVDHTPYLQDTRSVSKTGAVQAKRGCAQSCIYCIVPAVEGTCVRLRPVAQIVDEIENLAKQGVYSFWFADSEFNCPDEHAEEICREIIARGLPEVISWNAYIAPKPFSKELAGLMKEAGCRAAVDCIDHGVDEMLERIGKDFRAEDIREAVIAAREAGLNVGHCLMLGGPGDSMDGMLKTLELLLSLRPLNVVWADPPGMRVYPNSPLADIVAQEGFDKKNRNLSGHIKANENLLLPVYYLSRKMGILAPGVKLWRRIGHARFRWKNRVAG
ncbi:MAG: radical SAM protein [Armatimonadota bacterium]|nr:radical SAM protein [Armatimonadota bacterium]